MPYIELLEPVPPRNSDFGFMGAMDSTHIFTVGNDRWSVAQPGNVPERAFAIMNTTTSEAGVYYGGFGYRTGRVGSAFHAGRAWLMSTENDYEGSGNILLHAVETDGGVYTVVTGVFVNLTVGDAALYGQGVGDEFWFRWHQSGVYYTRSYSMASATLGTVLWNQAVPPTNTATGVAITASQWQTMNYKVVAGTLYGWDSNTTTLWSVNSGAWTVTPLVVSNAAQAVTAHPTNYVNGRYWGGPGIYFSLATMTGGQFVGGSIRGPIALGPDGNIYWVQDAATLRVLDPISGASNTAALPSRSDRYGVAYLDGRLWCPSGAPFT